MKKAIVCVTVCWLVSILLAFNHTPAGRSQPVLAASDASGGFYTPNRDWRLKQVHYFLDENSTGTLHNNYRKVLYYNPSQALQVDSVYTFNFAAQDSSWYITSDVWNIWNQGGGFVDEHYFSFGPGQPPMSRFKRDYDEQNRLLSNNCDNLFINVWINSVRNHYIYDGNLLDKRVTHYHDYTSNTNLFVCSDYSHDNRGRIIEEERSTSEDSLTWEPDVNFYIAYQQDDVSTWEQYISRISRIDMMSYVFEIPSYGMVSEIYSQSYYETDWFNSEKIKYNYDPAGRMISEVHKHFATDWIDDSSNLYEYDANGNLAGISRLVWNDETQSWGLPYEVLTLNWENSTAAEDDHLAPVSELILQVYPNPFAQKTLISCISKNKQPITAAVYNCKGQMVKTFGKISQNCCWDGLDKDGRQVPTGIYFIRAEQNGKAFLRKLVRLQ